MKKFGKIVLFIGAGATAMLIFIIVLAVALSGESETVTEPLEPIEAQADATTKETEKPAEEKAKEPEKVAKIGDSIQVGDMIFKVEGRDKAKNVGGEYGVTANGEFLVLDVSVQNKGNEAKMIDTSFFKLSSEGKTYEADDSAGIYANENGDFFYAEINPDVTMTGKVVFDIPAELHDKALTLVVQSGMFETKTGQINLQ